MRKPIWCKKHRAEEKAKKFKKELDEDAAPWYYIRVASRKEKLLEQHKAGWFMEQSCKNLDK